MHFIPFVRGKVKLDVTRAAVIRWCILPSVLCFMLNVNAQETSSKKGQWGGLASTGFSYGIQSISIPPLFQKVSVGIGYSRKPIAFYLLPGLTFGIAPWNSYHIESGMKLYFLTFDYSANWTQISGVPQTFVDQSLNLGVQIKLNPNGKDNLFLWMKGGNSFFERGYNEEYKPKWEGYNAELKLVLTGFDNP